MAQPKICNEAYDRSIDILRRCVHEVGMQASARVPGYAQVWARDSMITLLGASLIDDRSIRQSLYRSIETLADHQTPLGLVPNNVDVHTGETSFQAYADSGLWFVVGTDILSRVTGNHQFLERVYPAVRRTLNWYSYQDVDQSGLISMVEGSDWQDLFAVRNKGTYVNVLYYLALKFSERLALRMNDNALAREYSQSAQRFKERINYFCWHRGPQDVARHLQFGSGGISYEHAKRFIELRKNHYESHHSALADREFYLPYITFRDFGDHFDSLANLLAIMSGVADDKQTDSIFSLIDEFQVAKPYPIRAIAPPIEVGGRDWRYYYLFAGLNEPHCYHNGGVWPFVGGFYVAALVYADRMRDAEDALVALAESNRLGRDGREWEFNEWLHGESNEPRGMADQAWSAGMYIFAHEAVERKEVPYFDNIPQKAEQDQANSHSTSPSQDGNQIRAEQQHVRNHS